MYMLLCNPHLRDVYYHVILVNSVFCLVVYPRSCVPCVSQIMSCAISTSMAGLCITDNLCTVCMYVRSFRSMYCCIRMYAHMYQWLYLCFTHVPVFTVQAFELHDRFIGLHRGEHKRCVEWIYLRARGEPHC